MTESSCEHCGAKIVEHKQSLAQILVNSLRALAAHGRPGTVVKFRELTGLTFSERTSFQKLQYWGLVQKAQPNKKNGEWVLTERGQEFLDGLLALPLHVWTYRNQTVAESVQRIYVHQATKKIRQTADYIADMIPHV